MGRDLYGASTVARDLYDRADALLGRDISRLCFEGPIEELSKTANAQPAIYVTSLACLAVARDVAALGREPAFVAGHSLGEYTALAAAGALTFDDGLRLVEQRGRLTQAAADATPGAMAAVLGLDEPTAASLCAESGAELCNINSPGQLVIGGPTSPGPAPWRWSVAPGGRSRSMLTARSIRRSCRPPPRACARRSMPPRSIRRPFRW